MKSYFLCAVFNKEQILTEKSDYKLKNRLFQSNPLYYFQNESFIFIWSGLSNLEEHRCIEYLCTLWAALWDTSVSAVVSLCVVDSSFCWWPIRLFIATGAQAYVCVSFPPVFVQAHLCCWQSGPSYSSYSGRLLWSGVHDYRPECHGGWGLVCLCWLLCGQSCREQDCG